MKKIHESENMSSVIQSPAMQAPPPNRMLAYHSDPIQKNPPQVHSRIWQKDNGSYAISRPFNIATKDKKSEVTQDFINYILSEDGQKVIESNGYIKASDAGAFKSNGAKGKIVVAGSSSVTPVMEKLAESYKTVNSGAEIEIQESDSTTGVTAAIDGTCDIGMASRELKEEETGVSATKIAMDGIAVIVNKENPITELTSEDVLNIYTGVTTDWSEIAQ